MLTRVVLRANNLLFPLQNSILGDWKSYAWLGCLLAVCFAGKEAWLSYFSVLAKESKLRS